MTAGQQQVGLVGLGVMGENLALNIQQRGVAVAVYNRTPDRLDAFAARVQRGGQFRFCRTPQELVATLQRPRCILLMIQAGQPVDDMLAQLVPLLQEGDLVIDGGNEHFAHTERRARQLAASGLHYLGMGISGGAEGARHGPSLMAGGSRPGYERMEPLLARIAAQVEGEDGGPCVAYLGPGGAGHYVKMVHNGIEYGDMQLIAEAYDLLRSLGGLSNRELAEVFAAWNEGELRSFLIEITARIFRTRDPLGGGDLIDQVLDVAAQKGTGRWTVQDAAELGTPVPVIALAVEARLLSAARQVRAAARQVLPGPPAGRLVGDKKQLIDDVRQALYCAKACSYAQGMRLLQVASAARGWDLPLSQIAAIWRGGCIIRAQFLGRIRAAFARDPQLQNLLLDPSFVEDLRVRHDAWRRTVALAAQAGVPALCMGAALAYYDMLRRERLPANLIQAQRDLFGAHTYERVDRPGTFHTEWAS
ncbi:MAG: NADP-dependent phosphogluconate dehydrogenase [Myxococcales bacterium]|nr:NADP-dependent phosphogluconate dehydrogenase [Myxococcota bacterium]MDW8282208.1 NADP-dependent phosphogluconate dehydrogenase [Myxococcales bacterium]